VSFKNRKNKKFIVPTPTELNAAMQKADYWEMKYKEVQQSNLQNIAQLDELKAKNNLYTKRLRKTSRESFIIGLLIGWGISMLFWIGWELLS
jgi:hypothetical protein